MRRSRKNKETLQTLQTPQEFAKKNWGAIATIASLGGAGIVLLIRYYRHRQKVEGKQIDVSLSRQLDVLENEAQSDVPEVVKMLETAPEVKKTLEKLGVSSGVDVNEIIRALAQGVPEVQAKQILDILSQIDQKK